jgi:hypothetical protein
MIISSAVVNNAPHYTAGGRFRFAPFPLRRFQMRFPGGGSQLAGEIARLKNRKFFLFSCTIFKEEVPLWFVF